MLKDVYDKYILGIAVGNEDCSVTLIKGSNILVVVNESQFCKVGKDVDLPYFAIKNVLKKHNLSLAKIDHIVYSRNPRINFKEILVRYVFKNYGNLESFINYDCKLFKDNFLFQKRIINNFLKIQKPSDSNNSLNFAKKKSKELSFKISFVNSDIAGCGACFYPSKFKESAILICDDEHPTPLFTMALGVDKRIKIVSSLNFVNNFISFRKAIFLLFKKADDDFFTEKFSDKQQQICDNFIEQNILNYKENGAVIFNKKNFKIKGNQLFFSSKLKNQIFELAINFSNHQQFKNCFFKSYLSIEKQLIISSLRHLKKITKSNNLVINNCKIFNENFIIELKKLAIFENIWIQNLSGASLYAFGGGLIKSHFNLNYSRSFAFKNTYTINTNCYGQNFSNDEIKNNLDCFQASYLLIENEKNLSNILAQNLNQQKIIAGNFGKIQFNNNAFDTRGIWLAVDISSKINLSEFFLRDFNIVCCRGEFLDFFAIKTDQYKLLSNSDKCLKILNDISLVINNKKIKPLYSLNQFDNKLIYQTIHNFYQQNNCKVILNFPWLLTYNPLSFRFNDYLQLFKNSPIDILAIENYILFKEDQAFE